MKKKTVNWLKGLLESCMYREYREETKELGTGSHNPNTGS